MTTQMNSLALIALLTHPGTPKVTLSGVTGTLSSIQREDVSGRSFNVTLQTVDGPRTVYVRCPI